MNKREVFKQLLDNFETDKMRMYCEEMIDTIPDYIFTMPSSTTGKHHNATQCQRHGQVFHVIMFGTVMNYLLALRCNKQKFPSPEQRDSMRCVPIFHDAIKCGVGGSQFTVHEHPMMAGAWVRETKVVHDIDDALKETIARMCERHSGEWTSSKRSKTVLPEPETDMEILCHECDILSSRSDIDMQPPEEVVALFAAAEAADAAQVTIHEASPLELKINDVINLCRAKIEKGVNRDAIYAAIEKIAGAKNPRKIPDIKAIATQTDLNSRQLDLLIKIDYFQKFGNSKELLRINDMFNFFKQGSAKTIKKQGLAPEMQTLISQYATDKNAKGVELKSFTIIDINALMQACEDYIRSLKLDDLDMKVKIQNSIDILGYVDIVTNRPEDRCRLLIADVIPMKSKESGNIWGYRVETRSLGTGKTARITIRTKVFDANPVKKGNIVFTTPRDLWRNDQGYWYLLRYTREA